MQAGGAEVVVVVDVAVASVDAMEVASANRGRSNAIIDQVEWKCCQSAKLRKAKNGGSEVIWLQHGTFI